MFDFLKKKISGFIDGLTKKEAEPEEGKGKRAGELEKKIEEPEATPEIIEEHEEVPPETIETPRIEERKPEIIEERKIEGKKQEPAIERTKPEPVIEKKKIEPARKPPVEKKAEPIARKPEIVKEAKPEPESGKKPESESKKPFQPETRKTPQPEIKKPAPVREEVEAKPAPKPPALKIITEPPELIHTKPEQKLETKPPIIPEQAKPITKPVTKPVQNLSAKPPEPAKPRIQLSPFSAIKSIITNEVEIKDSDVRDMLSGLELELLESDVEMGVAQMIVEDLSARLIGAKVKKGELHSFISATIRQALTDILINEKSFDLIERMNAAEKPMKIMFIGINGAGKTTTIAKVARLIMDNEKKVVFAAADTFRAAAIEQIEVHASRLGVKTIKRDYGADPTSVAFDAVGYAKAHAIDAVLIDTAGRQDTNISLLNEIKKMSRVIQPDLKIYIGESLSGNAILEQISSFNREVGIDAVILTKMDCDPKGGTMLSISKATGIPIIYVGTGQAYTDLERFEPEKIARRIVG